MAKKDKEFNVSRRKFIKEGAALGVGATALAGVGAQEAAAQARVRWDQTADVVIVGAGASGLPAAIMARDQGASVIVIDANHDVGGHSILSGGNVPLGGGTSQQKKYGIEDSADQVYLDHTNHANPQMRFCDRELVRVWANENVPTFEFLIENGVKFQDLKPTLFNGGTIPRQTVVQVYSDDLNETINGQNGSGLARALEKSARAKGAVILLKHTMTKIVRESPTSGKVLGITAKFENKDVNIQAKKGVILCTGGHTSNVEFRRMFDPRLTEEYQVAGEPWSKQTGDGEIQALAIGAALWATANQQNEGGRAVMKTRHIGCRYGYVNLKWKPKSPMFSQAGASGLTIGTWQDVILVNQVGLRFWNEMDESYAFRHAALGTNGNLGKDGKPNGGGPIWAIFDADAVTREKWEPNPPNVDLNGFFFSADTLAELAGKIKNTYQRHPMTGSALEQTVAKYNSYVEMGKDMEFGKPTPMFKIQKPPFYAAWSTPILHDTLTGLKINTRCQVIDTQGQVIPGLYAAGETAGGFALHGLPRVTVFGRIAGREAATVKV
jgi:FAD binding domain-containing protein